MTTIIRGARVVGPRDVHKADIQIEGGRITRIGRAGRAAGATVIDASGLYALPGFVDIHTHGGGGFDATVGTYNPSAKTFDNAPAQYRKALPKLMKRFARHGVTRALLATFAAPLSDLETALSQIADYIESPANGTDGSLLSGLFIEGTFLKCANHAGAQNSANFCKPSAKTFDRLNRAARGTIRYVNVVPEYGQAALGLTRRLTEQGVLVGCGHSNCDAERVERAADAGLRVAVHFLNGPTGQLYKPFKGGNVQEAFLRNNSLYTELIADGWHVAPAYIMDVIRRKGYKRVVAVTDTMFGADIHGLRSFTSGGIAGAVHSSGQYVHTKRDPFTLFGSLLNMATAFGNLVTWLTADMAGVWYARHPVVDLETALVRAVQMCSTNPAALLGMDKNSADGIGRLKEGRCADIVLADLAHKPTGYKLGVKHTFVQGRRVV